MNFVSAEARRERAFGKSMRHAHFVVTPTQSSRSCDETIEVRAEAQIPERKKTATLSDRGSNLTATVR